MIARSLCSFITATALTGLLVSVASGLQAQTASDYDAQSR
jgi:hypothetical protein